MGAVVGVQKQRRQVVVGPVLGLLPVHEEAQLLAVDHGDRPARQHAEPGRGRPSADAPPWSERGRAGKFVTACRRMAQEGTGARLAVDRAADGVFLGWCSLTEWNPDHRSASLGYCFDDAAWGHGYATEAARAVLRWAFDTLDLNRVQAETDTRNLASARVLEKLGFVREGTLREDCVVHGEVSDSWVYGLIRREWQPSSEPVPAG
ncbi:GNAT family N-acetyltransferase [Streptomyces adustus]|uniref:GNAT family N-acetyltransferase n=1 Tax=Streptomyces adustus TaxID=1609272 RepID=A0A5N8VGD5_9ACTN|nr:GNAT family N-acetyltransferase [Streptomyces adustus]